MAANKLEIIWCRSRRFVAWDSSWGIGLLCRVLHRLTDSESRGTRPCIATQSMYRSHVWKQIHMPRVFTAWPVA